MRYPTGMTRHLLWGCTFLICIIMAMLFDGRGLVIDWAITSALLIWHVRAQRPKAQK